MKKVVIAGGTGFLGQVLEEHFSNHQFLVKILTRHPQKPNHVYWDGQNIGIWKEEFENAELLINLCGKSVDCRYTEKNKKAIYDSRIETTHLLGLAINLCENPPKTWINSSTATIYESSLNKPMTEENGDIGNDFSMNIAKAWEKAFYSIPNPKTRKVAIRTSIVMGKNGGAFTPLKNITKLGLGGPQGSGQQKVSWIHEIDFARALYFILKKKDLQGAINISVPNPITNRQLMSTLRHLMTIPFGLPQPVWLVNLGAKLIGTESELVLKSRNVIPERLLREGFSFLFPEIEPALIQILKT